MSSRGETATATALSIKWSIVIGSIQWATAML